MTNTILTIMMHGLIALVPESATPGANNLMRAILLDGTNPPVQECMTAHKPILSFRVDPGSVSVCEDAGCGFTGNLCECGAALVRKKVTIEVQGLSPSPPFQLPAPPLPADEIPSNWSSGASYAYVPNLQKAPFNQVLRQDVRSGVPPKEVLSRISFPFTSLTTCGLAGRWDKDIKNVHSFSFQKLHAVGKAADSSQAMASSVAATLVDPAPAGTPRTVTLRIENFDGTTMYSMTLLNGPMGAFVDLRNEVEELRPDDPCDDGVGRHFAQYYELVESPPLAGDRLIPRLRPGRGVVLPDGTFGSLPDQRPDVCSHVGKGPMDRPICPMVTFY